MATMRRTAATITIALVWIITLGSPAAAHSVAGVSATNFLTTIASITPSIDGIDVDVIEGGNRIQVTNTTSTDVIVPGYQDEPYLRIAPDGVYENLRSPATYLNRDRQANTPVPGTADPEAEPDWSKIADEPAARWHDHRIHWMGDQNPPGVRRNSDQRQIVIPDWTISLSTADTTIDIHGQLEWIPGPPRWPWLTAAVALAALTIAAGLTRRFHAALAMLLAVVVGLDIIHAAGTGRAVTGSLATQLNETLSGSYLSLVGWAAGIAAVVLLARRDDRGLYAAGFAALFIALNGGLIDLTDLGRSQLAYAWPDNLARAAITASLGLGLGITAATTYRILRPRASKPGSSAQA